MWFPLLRWAQLLRQSLGSYPKGVALGKFHFSLARSDVSVCGVWIPVGFWSSNGKILCALLSKKERNMRNSRWWRILYDSAKIWAAYVGNAYAAGNSDMMCITVQECIIFREDWSYLICVVNPKELKGKNKKEVLQLEEGSWKGAR